ncbi:MAG: peroxiredoxin family protein [Actinobacteria bacterium]|nr:peroxiredoxin family protein [Actinomycetota bacterium]
MGHIRDIYPELEKRGAKVVVIFAERLERMRDYLKEHSFPFPFLSDGGRVVVKEYGVYVRVNFESVHIARPANFILDAEGTVRYIFIASIQTEYAKDEDLFAILDEMKT